MPKQCGSRSVRCAGLLAALLAWIQAVPASPGEEFFEQEGDYFESETIEGVSKHAEAPSETPATVTIVSRQEIERYGWRTVADVLNFASIGYATHNDRRYDFAGGRGLFFHEDFNTRILIMLDGHPLNEPWNNFGGVAREMLVPLDLAERVEIVYGPSSLLYGGYSLYGIVNVVTHTGGSLAGTGVRLAAGTRGTLEGALSFGASGILGNGDETKPAGTWDVLVAAGLYDSSGEDLDLPRIDVAYPVDFQGGTVWGGPQSGADYERASSAFLFARAGELSILGRTGYREHGAALAPYESVYGSSLESVRDDKDFLEVRWDHPLTSRADFSLRLFQDWYRYEEHDPYADDQTYPGELGYEFVLAADDVDRGAEARMSARLGTHFVTMGAEYRDRSITQQAYDQFFDGRQAAGSLIREEVQGRLLVAYLQEEWRPSDHITLVAGGNWADTRPGGQKALPRLAVIYKPFQDVALKALYSAGFRPPSVFEASYHDISAQINNPALRSEEMASTELSALWSVTRRVALQAYVFRSVLDDLIQAVTIEDPAQAQGGVLPPSGDPNDLVGFLQYQSAGDVRSVGVGAGARFKTRPLSGYVNVAYAHGKLTAMDGTTADLPATSEWLGSGGISYEHGPWTVALCARYVGRHSLDPSRQETGAAGGFLEANARVAWRARFTYPTQFFVDVRNLLDGKGDLSASPIYTPSRVPIEGRQVLLGVTARF